MKLKLNSPLAHFYCLFYDKTILPNNLCTYFWKLLIGIICAPLLLPTLILNYFFGVYYNKNKKQYESGNILPNGLGLLFHVVIIICGGFVSVFLYGEILAKSLSLCAIYFNGILLILGVVCIILLIIKTVQYTYNRQPKKQLSDEEQHQEYLKLMEKLRIADVKKKSSFLYIMKHTIIAWKEKNCPLITWENEK